MKRYRNVNGRGQIIAILLSALIASCGGNSGDGNTPPTTNPPQTSPATPTSGVPTSTGLTTPRISVTKFGAMCSRYGWVSRAYQEAGWGVWPFRVDVFLVTPAGEKGQSIFSFIPAGAVQRIGGSSPVIDFPGYLDTTSLVRSLNENIEKHIIIECSYGEPARGQVQTLGTMIAVNQMDSKVAVISPFTEIVYRAKQSAMSKGLSVAASEASALAAVESRFPLAAARLQPYPNGNYDGLVQQFDGNTSAFFSQAMALYEHAYPNFRENITAYARQAAAASLGDCTNIEFCIVYAPGRSQQLLVNSELSNGKTGWRENVSLVPGHVGSITVTTEGVASRAILELSPNSTRSRDRSYVEISQRLELGTQNISSLIFTASAGDLKAGSTWINNFAASGITGAFLCFESGTVTLGCYLAGYHFDAITLPIKVGEAFKIASTSNFSYDFIRDRGFVRMKSVLAIAQTMPDVASRINQISAVTVGAVAGETTSAALDHCYLCFSKIDIGSIGVERLK